MFSNSKTFMMLWCLLISPVIGLSARTRPDVYFKRTGFDRIEFGGSLNVGSVLPADVSSREFRAFVTPERIIKAAWDPRMVENLGNNVFRLKQEPLDFAGALRILTSVDVEVLPFKETGLDLQSLDIASMAAIGLEEPKRLDVNIKLKGRLEPQNLSTVAKIQGGFTFSVDGRLVGPLLFLPDPVLSAAARSVVMGIVAYAQNRFINGVKRDFRLWRTTQQRLRDRSSSSSAFSEREGTPQEGSSAVSSPPRNDGSALSTDAGSEQR